MHGKVTVTEWPTWLPYSCCSYLCGKSTEMGQVSLEWRSTSLVPRLPSPGCEKNKLRQREAWSNSSHVCDVRYLDDVTTHQMLPRLSDRAKMKALLSHKYSQAIVLATIIDFSRSFKQRWVSYRLLGFWLSTVSPLLHICNHVIIKVVRSVNLYCELNHKRRAMSVCNEVE